MFDKYIINIISPLFESRDATMTSPRIYNLSYTNKTVLKLKTKRRHLKLFFTTTLKFHLFLHVLSVWQKQLKSKCPPSKHTAAKNAVDNKCYNIFKIYTILVVIVPFFSSISFHRWIQTPNWKRKLRSAFLEEMVMLYFKGL